MSPYSIDLRKKIFEAYQAGGQSQRGIASRFGVSLSFVQNLLKRYKQTGTIKPKPHGGGQKAKIGPEVLKRIEEIYDESPELTPSDVRLLVQEEYGLQVSSVTIYRAIEKLGISRSKGRRQRAARSSKRNVKPDEKLKAKGAGH